MTYSFDFVKHRNKFFALTILTTLLACAFLFLQGLNLGIDFVSGTRLDIKFDSKVDLVQAKEVLRQVGYENPNVKLGGTSHNILIFQLDKKLDKAAVDKISSAIRAKFNQKIDLQENTVDPIIGRELAQNAMVAVLIASIGIVIYISLRFEYRFAIAAILSLLYDALITIGLFSALQLEVDLVFVAAILTIIGYSITDTIVIFDRIRENIAAHKSSNWDELAAAVNNSINQTLTRSINTVMTVIFAAAALFFFGGESIKYFSLALLVGIFSGAYSSIFVASQVWIAWKKRAILKASKA